MPELAEGLAGRTVVVTGAAGGIGAEIARGVAAAGGIVCGMDLPGPALEAVLAALPGDGHWALPTDLGDPAQVDAAVAAVAERAVHPLGLAHAAAYLVREPLEEVTVEHFDRQVDVNLRGTFFLARGIADLLAERGDGGRIVLFTSAAWMVGPINGSDAYAATKAGVVTMSRGFARRYGPANVTVNVISPGQIDTAMQRQNATEEDLARIAASAPLGRMGRPEEVASVALFLLSDHASFVSGATVNVSGALLMY